MRLKELRKEENLTQKRIATLLNISQQTYSDYENGKTNPDLQTLNKLADILHVSIDYLLGRTDELGGVMISPTVPILTDDETQLLALFAKMSHPMKIRALAYCEGLLSSDPKRASKA